MSTAATDAPAKAATDEKTKHPRDPAREVIETVVFVVVLVLLLKLFVTEAFVIPTGSMAETLYGYQKVITCPKCGHEFPVNSHDEVEVNSATKRKHPLVKFCCPNCRHEGEVRDLNPLPENRTGDRVLVLKPLFHLRPPHRGDVVVFKYPEDPQQLHTAQNYIKRAMGFGGETIAIHRGELYVTTSLTYREEDVDADGNLRHPRPTNLLDLWKLQYTYANNSSHADTLFQASRQTGFTGGVPGGFQIVRKGEDQILADRRIVWDNDKQPADLPATAQRWVRTNATWKADNEKKPLAFLHNGPDEDWIRYRHAVWTYSVPSPYPWKWPGSDTVATAARVSDAARRLKTELWQHPEQRPETTLLGSTDDKTLEISLSLFQGVFTAASPIPGPIDNVLGYNSGTDLNTKSNEEQSRDNAEGRPQQLWVGDLILECEVELAAGAEVALELSKGSDRFRATFGGGKVTLTRSGGKVGEMGSKPCRVTAGTYKLRFANVDSRLWVWVNGSRIDFGPEADYNPTEPKDYEPEDANKEGWTRANDIEAPASIGAKGQVTARQIKLHRDVYYTRSRPADHTGADIYYVHPGHYLCLGDNSAQSSDSRSWGTVPERLMLGKAVFVFWPGYPRPNRVGFIK